MTKREQQALSAWRSLYGKRPPTAAELGVALGVSRARAGQLIQSLRSQGALDKMQVPKGEEVQQDTPVVHATHTAEPAGLISPAALVYYNDAVTAVLKASYRHANLTGRIDGGYVTVTRSTATGSVSARLPVELYGAERATHRCANAVMRVEIPRP